MGAAHAPAHASTRPLQDCCRSAPFRSGAINCGHRAIEDRLPGNAASRQWHLHTCSPRSCPCLGASVVCRTPRAALPGRRGTRNPLRRHSGPWCRARGGANEPGDTNRATPQRDCRSLRTNAVRAQSTQARRAGCCTRRTPPPHPARAPTRRPDPVAHVRFPWRTSRPMTGPAPAAYPLRAVTSPRFRVRSAARRFGPGCWHRVGWRGATGGWGPGVCLVGWLGPVRGGLRGRW